MQLTQEQKQSVSQWVNEGASLKEVQERLAEEFSVNMTYMDVRFLVDDLDLELVDKNAKPEPTEHTNEQASGEGVHYHEEDAPEPMPTESMTAAEEPADAEAEFVGGSVSVEVDKLTRPGAVVSGDVTFSDGAKAGWQLDQTGRLGLIPPEGQADFRPSEEDIQEFQKALQAELQKQGF